MSARIGDGEVFDSAKLKNTVRFLIENDMRNVVIDLGNLEYLYSDTINAFIASNRHMLEVSGRIAILTEHPKVQDILKRAGLDNIMRIYRSEAEMIADSKEILRQTSSYRIEELQKISTQPQGESAPAPSPRTEFDDFKMEMGQRLGSKLDNNEVPQYQLGVTPSAAPAGFGAPPARETPAYPTFNQPGFSAPPPQAVPGQGQPGYVPSQPAPAFGSFNNAPTYGGAANGTANGAPAFGGNPSTGFGGGPAAPSNFDFPTVQLPVGGYGGNTQPLSGSPQTREAPVDPAAPGYGPGDAGDSDPRARKPSQERMRSPNARRQQGRRVGGREFPGGMDEGPDSGAYVEERAQEIQPPVEAYGGYVPPATSNSLIEESKSPGKLILFVVVLALVGGAVFWALSSGGSEEDTLPENMPAAVPNPEPPTVVTPPAAPEGATDPTAVAPAAPATPATPATPAAPSAPAATQEPAVAKPAAPAVPEKPKPEPKQFATRTPPAPKRPRTERVERPVKAPVAVEPDDEPPSQPAIPQGKLRITSTPSGAEVLVNFSKKGVTPTDISLLNNSNKIIVRLPGYKRFETMVPKNHPDRELDVTLEREGEEEPVARTPEPEAQRPVPKLLPDDGDEEKDPYEDLPMKPEPRKPEIAKQNPPKPKPEVSPTPGDGPIGVIFLSSSPARADIIIDGKNTGKKTPAKVELPSGQHRIEMVKSGQRAVVDQPVNEGKNKALHLNLQ